MLATINRKKGGDQHMKPQLRPPYVSLLQGPVGGAMLGIHYDMLKHGTEGATLVVNA